ncbi:hypothetical protein NLG97_g7259 [Lecanicillium saksenae]|uniref:Uncharacterized protein n=1 Tax=Lecanicillium saksenae TaxID=468837 RepID=A0ACC1QPN4_9HYPO|nr:hypothetical protein NLG97_g7259 [Lecanicillium saksenae]
MPQAYGSFTPMAIPSYGDPAPPEYGSGASIQATSVTSTSSSQSSTSSTSSLSSSVSTSSSSSKSAPESIPTYGYNFQSPGDSKASASATSAAQGTTSKSASEEDRPEGATSFLSSDPGHEVENTASSESTSQIPGIETVPPPNKGSATSSAQAPATTQMLPIGGPPVLFVTIIEPDANGNLETSVLTVSEKSPWPTPKPEAKQEVKTLHARVDGYRMGVSPDFVAQDPNPPTSTMTPVNSVNNTSALAEATSNATATPSEGPDAGTPASLPLVSSASTMDNYLCKFAILSLSWIITVWTLI